ncbi:MAG: OadG family protein [Bacteroidaceae bacterium]|nr:OadG family protein [Bacteroidaceae bacterium]
MDNINIGLELMAVGMATVFLILIIVIQLGKLLISMVNKFAPEEAVAPKKTAAVAQPAATVDAGTMAVLAEAVKQITGGKGKISKVTKL